MLSSGRIPGILSHSSKPPMLRPYGHSSSPLCPSCARGKVPQQVGSCPRRRLSRTFARRCVAEAMEQDEILQLPAETLEQEKATDKKLTEIPNTVNKQALAETEEGEEDDKLDADEIDEDEEEQVAAGPNTASNRGGKK